MKKVAEKEDLRSKINCWRKILNKKAADVTKTEARVSSADRWRHTPFLPSSEIKEKEGQGEGRKAFEKPWYMEQKSWGCCRLFLKSWGCSLFEWQWGQRSLHGSNPHSPLTIYKSCSLNIQAHKTLGSVLCRENFRRTLLSWALRNDQLSWPCWRLTRLAASWQQQTFLPF